MVPHCLVPSCFWLWIKRVCNKLINILPSPPGCLKLPPESAEHAHSMLVAAQVPV